MTITTIRDRVSRLAGLLAREREALAEFISELADFDLGRCWEELGYPSLFEFLVRELHLSRGNAFYRTKAIDLVRRFPEVLEALREGKLCISCIPEVARVLTPENRIEVLPRFFHLSREDAKLLSVELAPRQAVPIRELVTGAGPSRMATPAAPALAIARPMSPAPAPTLPTPVQPLNCDDPKVLDRTEHRIGAVQPEAPEPMTGQLSRVHLTVTRELLRKIEAAQLALSHARPGATIVDILELGADTALAQDARRKGLVANPRRHQPGMQPPASDHIPAEIRRAVWKRDEGCCQWKPASGEICGSRYRVQFDHIQPRGKGGETTVSNLRILCQRHNLLAARMAYGNPVLERYQRRRAESAASPPQPQSACSWRRSAGVPGPRSERTPEPPANPHLEHTDVHR